MAVTTAVVTGTLSNTLNGTTDFTSSGFGTVDCALIFVGAASSQSNPTNSLSSIGIGFWEPGGGTPVQMAVGVTSIASSSTTQTGRAARSNNCVTIPQGSSNNTYIRCTATAITDGIRIENIDDDTTVSRHTIVVLFAGLVNVDIQQVQQSTATVTTGFRPDLIFATSVGAGAAPLAETPSILSFGVAHIDSSDTITQRCLHGFDVDNVSTTDCGQYLNTSAIAGQLYNSTTLTWANAITGVSSTNFTCSAPSGGDRAYYLAIELDDPDDAAVGTLTYKSSTTGTESTTTGFQPQLLGIIGSLLSSLNTGTEENTIFLLGAADGTTEASLYASSEHNVSSNNEQTSEFDSSNVLNADLTNIGSDTRQRIASLDSFDSNGFTLDYTTVSDATTRYGIWWALKDTEAGISIEVPSADLTLSTTAPTVETTVSLDITVPQADLTLSTTAPTVSVTAGLDISVPQADLVLSTTAPTVEATANLEITVPQTDLTLSTTAPTASTTESLEVTVPQADLVLSTTAPTTTATDNQEVTVPQADLVLSTTAPTVVATEAGVIQVPQTDLVLSTTAPTVETTTAADIEVPQTDLVLSTTAPTAQVSENIGISPDAGQLLLSTVAPELAISVNTGIEVPTADLLLSTTAPTVTATVSALLTIPQADLTLSTTAPTVEATGVDIWTIIPPVTTIWTEIN